MAQPIDDRVNAALANIEEAVQGLEKEFELQKLGQHVERRDDGSILIEVTYSVADIHSSLSDVYRYRMLVLENGENVLRVDRISPRN